MTDKEQSRAKFDVLLERYPVLKQILYNIKQVVWILDTSNAQLLFVSPAFEQVWGRSCDNLYADPRLMYEWIHPEDRVKVMSVGIDRNQQTLSQTYRILQPDGSPRWISADTFLIADEVANTFYQVCVASDITGQSQLDETLRKALDRSREQSSLSRRMSLAKKPEAVLKILMSAAELRAAKRAAVLFFEAPLSGPAHGLEVIASWSPASAQADDNQLEAFNEVILFEDLSGLDIFSPSKPVILSEIADDPRLTPEIRDQLLNNQIQSAAIFPLIALGNWLGSLFVFFSQGKHFEPIVLRHIKVLVDQATITLNNLQLLKIEAESRAEAERANEIKTKFLAMISHELRTPLTSIKGFTTTLLADDVTWEPEEQRDFVQTIETETNRLQELIDHLLDLSRLEAGMLPIVLAPHSLHEILQEALPQLQRMAQKHTLSLRLPAELPLVSVDAKRIIQVLVNLVHNAVLYTPGGTDILLTAHVRGAFMQVNVIDQGPGIAPAERKRVFQAFQRGKQEEDGAGKGAGLGLAICKGLVEAHGGRIWIKRRAVPGTTFSFTIPLVPTSEQIIESEKG